LRVGRPCGTDLRSVQNPAFSVSLWGTALVSSLGEFFPSPARRIAFQIEPDNVLFKTNRERLAHSAIAPMGGREEPGAAEAQR